VSDPKLTYEEILEVVKVFESSPDFNELHLKYGDTEIDLRKYGAETTPAEWPSDGAAVKARQASGSQRITEPLARPTDSKGAAATPAATPVAPAISGSSAASAASTFAPNARLVRSPMVGAFYRAPEPGAAPFVAVGQRVSPDSTVCIIEVMKLMNSVQAGVSGVVSQVLVSDGDPVEFDQVLVVIDPDS
jgi:acetyl-CoA carboxylase biotin carboxyl carrier protein